MQGALENTVLLLRLALNDELADTDDELDELLNMLDDELDADDDADDEPDVTTVELDADSDGDVDWVVSTDAVAGGAPTAEMRAASVMVASATMDLPDRTRMPSPWLVIACTSSIIGIDAPSP